MVMWVAFGGNRGSVGWQEVLIAPNPGHLDSAEAVVQTPKGRIMSRWSIDNGLFRLETEIPKGVDAVAILPSGETKPLHSGTQTLEEEIVQTQ